MEITIPYNWTPRPYQLEVLKHKARFKELEQINEGHRQLNGKLHEVLDHWKEEAKIWKDLYEKELHKEVRVTSNCGLRLTK